MVSLCGRKGRCCPSLNKTGENEYTITDDFGGSVKLTNDQLSTILDAKKIVDNE